MTHIDSLSTLFDQSAARLSADTASVNDVISLLSAELRSAKLLLDDQEWRHVVESARYHPLLSLLHSDPLTQRAYLQPRGYQGDAELLDIIYERDYHRIVSSDKVSDLGKALFSRTIECKAPEAVRQRKAFLTKQIDLECARTKEVKILSVACGHLREVMETTAIPERRFGRFVGLDQDPASIAELASSVGRFGVEGVIGSIRHLFGGPLSKEKFDFIYSAGLYDYLDDDLAARLTSRMSKMLNPGGRLLIANYFPGIEDVGYMEAYMGWNLIYRDEEAMIRLAHRHAEQFETARAFRSAANTIVYLDLK